MPNQCAADGGLSANGGVARQRIVGNDIGAEQRQEHDQHEQAEGEPGDRVVADDVAGMAKRRHQPRERGAARAGALGAMLLMLRSSCAGR